MEAIFKQRIGFDGNLKEISEIICKEFNLGEFLACKIIPVGYEDFNFYLKTTEGRFFVKIFANSRSLDDCKRIVNIFVKAFTAGISIPKLYKSGQGYLHIKNIGHSILRICVMDFIEGKDFYSSKTKVTKEDMLSVTHQATLIDTLDIESSGIYDRWAIANFLQEFKKKSKYLDAQDLELINPFVKKFQDLNIEKLPHCFIHGDIIKTNTIKDKNNKIYIVDFSVSNYYPRIQELAVLACDMLFNKDSKKESEENLKNALKEYRKIIKLTPKELESLPTYIKLAHAMHVLGATFEKRVKNNNSAENDYFLEIGRAGLRQK